MKVLGLTYVPYVILFQHILGKWVIPQFRGKKHDQAINFQTCVLVTTPFSLGTYNLRMYWKGLKVKVKNHTKIANYENKQKSKTPSLISPWLGGRKGKMSETRSLLQFNIK